jgi:hypothetical protein
MKMNSLIGVVVLSLFPSLTGLSQGTFLFQNVGFGVDAPVFDAQGIPLAGPDYLAELYGGATPDSLAPATPRTAVPFFTGIGAGYFQAPYAVIIVGVPGGDLAWVQVRAWDARLGASYEEAVVLGLGGYGESILLHLRSGNPIVPTSPSALLGLQPFSLRPVVPEPSTWGLLALGGAAVWLAVWRKREPFW